MAGMAAGARARTPRRKPKHGHGWPLDFFFFFNNETIVPAAKRRGEAIGEAKRWKVLYDGPAGRKKEASLRVNFS